MHRVFPVEKVSELDVVDDAVAVGVAVVEELSELIIVQWNVKLTASLVQIFLRY